MAVSRRRAVSVTIAGILLALALAAGALQLHSVRAMLATWVERSLETRYPVDVRIGRLTYDLALLDVRLLDIAVASSDAPETPFFQARAIDLRLGAGTLLGRPSVTSATVHDPEVQLAYRADGSSNLPALPAPGAREASPMSLPVEAVTITGLGVRWSDAGRDASVDLQGLRLDLHRRDGRLSGTLEQADRSTIRVGARTTEITALAAAVEYAGSALTLERVTIVTPEVSVDAAARIADPFGNPMVDGRFKGTIALGELARWIEIEEPLDATLAVSGTIAGPLSRPRIASTIETGDLRWAELTQIGASLEGTFEGTTLRTDRLSLTSGDATLEARLSISFAGAAHVAGEARWQGITGDIVERAMPGLGLLGISTRSSGRGSVDWTPGRPGTLAVHLVSENVPAAGAGTPLRGRVTLDVRDGSWDLEADQRASGIHTLVARLAGHLNRSGEAPGWQTSPVAGALSLETSAVGRLAAEPVLSRLVPAPLRRIDGHARLALTLRGTPSELLAAGHLEGIRLRFEGNVAVERLDADLELSRDDVHVTAFAARQRDNSVSGSARLGFGDGTLDGRLHADLGEIGALRHRMPGWWPEGRATLDARVTGSLDRPAAEGRVVLSQVTSDRLGITGGSATAGIQISGSLESPADSAVRLELEALETRFAGSVLRLAGPARIEYDAGLAVDDLVLIAPGTRLEVDGRLAEGIPDTLRGSVDGDLGELAPLIRSLQLAFAPASARLDAIDGAVDLHGSLAYGPTGPGGSADLELRDVRVRLADGPEADGIRLHARYRDGTVTVSELRGTWQGAVLSGRAVLPRDWLRAQVGDADLPGRPPPATLSLHIDAVGPDTLAPWLDEPTRDRLELAVDAELELAFDRIARDAVSGRLRLARAEGSIAGMPLSQSRPTRIALERGRLTIADFSWTGPANRLDVRGGLDLTRQDGLDLRLAGDLDVRLATLLLPALASSGRSGFDIRIHGDPWDPRIDGTVDLDGAEARLATPRMAITGLHGRLLLADDRLEVAELRGLANGGALSVEGSLRRDGLGPKDGTLSIDARGVAMQLPEGLRSEINANLRLEVTAGRLALSGTTTIVRGAYREPITITSQLLAAVGRPQATVRTPGARSILDDVSLDIAVVTDNDIGVDNNYGRFSLGSDLRLIGSLARPSLTGRAAIREGGLLFLSGTVYQLEASAIDFANPTRIEPDLSLTARTRVSGYDITLRVTGTLDGLETDLSSDPALGESDIVSLLLTGRTLGEAGNAGAEVARDQVLGYLSGELASVAGRAVGLDVVRLERGTTASDVRFDSGLVAVETNPAARLTFGKRVSRELELIFSQSLARSGDFTWIVNYAPHRSTTIRFVSRDNEDRSYEFWHDLSFGGTALPASRGSAARDERVVAVELAGDTGFEEPELRRQLRLSAGERFDFYRWQDDRDRLVRFYRDREFLEARIRTRQTRTGDGVTIVYEIDRGPRTRLTIEGYEVTPATRRLMRDRWSAAIFDRFLIEDLERFVRRDLAAHRYLQASLEASVTRDASGSSKTIVVRVERGKALSSLELRFTGNDMISTDDLRLSARQAGPPELVFLDPSSLVAAVGELYRRRGMLEAEVAADPPLVTGGTGTLAISIQEGPRFRVGEIAFEGAGAPAGDPRQAFDISSGEPFDPARIERARRRLDDAYRRAGFNDVRISVDAESDPEAALVRLAVRVTPGPRQLLGAVEVRGLRDTNPSLVSRALRFTVGEPVNLSAWYQARKRLYDSGAFRRVDLEITPVEQALASDPDVQPVVTTVTVEEWPRYRLRYGFQVNDEHAPERDTTRDLSPGLVADLTRRNLFGRAIRAGLATRLQRRAQAGRAFLSMPSLFGLPVTSNVFVSGSRMDLGGGALRPLVTTQTSATAEQRLDLGGHARLSYGYTFGRTRTFERDPVPNDPFPFDVTVNIARLTTTATVDTRDDLLDATRGWFHSSSFEYASDLLGSDIRFGKYLGQLLMFRRLRRGVVLATAARLGVAGAFDQELIPSERFFAGGGNTVRGYAEDSLGDRTFLGDPAGGEALFIVNQEARVPLGRFLQGVGFLDAGRPFSSIGRFSLRELSTSVGFGVRIRTPVVMLRVDFGQPLDRIDGRRPPGRWFFSIGQMF